MRELHGALELHLVLVVVSTGEVVLSVHEAHAVVRERDKVDVVLVLLENGPTEVDVIYGEEDVT